jgi:hypothetical protein
MQGIPYQKNPHAFWYPAFLSSHQAFLKASHLVARHVVSCGVFHKTLPQPTTPEALHIL